jgi:hypothetical protein
MSPRAKVWDIINTWDRYMIRDIGPLVLIYRSLGTDDCVFNHDILSSSVSCLTSDSP